MLHDNHLYTTHHSTLQGLSSLGYPAIPNAMFDALCQCYADPKLTGFVRWKEFVSDVENKFGHTQSGRGEEFSASFLSSK